MGKGGLRGWLLGCGWLLGNGGCHVAVKRVVPVAVVFARIEVEVDGTGEAFVEVEAGNALCAEDREAETAGVRAVSVDEDVILLMPLLAGGRRDARLGGKDAFDNALDRDAHVLDFS